MSNETIATMAQDQSLRRRCMACLARLVVTGKVPQQKGPAGRVIGPSLEGQQFWLIVATPDWDDAYDKDSVNGVTDDMILAAVGKAFDASP